MTLTPGKLYRTRSGLIAIVTDVNPDGVRPARVFLIPSDTCFAECFYTLAGCHTMPPAHGEPEPHPLDITADYFPPAR